jgi:Zn ribbon nucleic-acid-binding protein
MSGQLHAPAAELPGRCPGKHWIGGWLDPRTDLDDWTAPILKIQHLGFPACSQSLYRLWSNNSIQFNSCLFKCKFNSTEANYKVSTVIRKYTKITKEQDTKHDSLYNGHKLMIVPRKNKLIINRWKNWISGSGTESTQPRENNWGATWMKK